MLIHKLRNYYFVLLIYIIPKVKKRAIPATGHGGLLGCEVLGIPHHIDNRLTDVTVRLSALCASHTLPQEILGKLKNSVISLGLEPMTFQLVA
jgi:hypothetical protein